MKKTPAPPTRVPLSPGLRRYLYFTAATTGAAIMVVEILGAKMLAPYVGTSHFVWTAQIAVTLVALAAGYEAGGRLVDRSPKLGRLYWAILFAAVYLAATALFVEPIAYACLDFNLALGSLLGSALLFFVPLALLAMVGPFLVRVLTVDVEAVGGNVGRLTAVSTLGSFAGTILIGYVLIPFLANSTTMAVTSGALLLVTAGYCFGWGRSETSVAAVGIAVASGFLLGGIGVASDRPMGGAGWHEIYRANSNFGRLQVISGRNDTRRFYLNDFLSQNIYDPSTKQSLSSFSYALHDLTAGYATRIEHVLCIGLGVGILPMQFAREGAQVDVVEINPAVVPLAERFFDLDPSRITLTIDDGRHFVNRSTKHYDVVILDAFLGDASPSHLMSREAFAGIARLLQPDGVLLINSFGELKPGRGFYTASLDRTLRAVFRNVRVHAAAWANVFFVASDRAELELRNKPDLDAIPESCRKDVTAVYAGLLHPDPNAGIVLTDDYNPVDYYDAANREEFRRQLAMDMRQP
jgi:predicted membrane-bound spermidine synthase